jgi:hypothetical protein
MSETSKKKGGMPPIRAKQKFKSGFNEKWAEFEFDYPSISGRKFLVSNLGRLASYLEDVNTDGYIIKPAYSKNNHENLAQLSTFQIVKNKKGVEEKVRVGQVIKLQVLVAKNFIPNDDPEKKTKIIFLDFDTMNAVAENLKWATPKEEKEHKRKNPKLEQILVQKYQKRKLSLSKARKLKTLVMEGRLKPTTLAKMFGLSLTQIYRIRWGEYLEDVEILSKEEMDKDNS